MSNEKAQNNEKRERGIWNIFTRTGQWLRTAFIEGRAVEEMYFDFHARIPLEEVITKGQIRLTVPNYITKELTQWTVGPDLLLMITVSRYHWEGDQRLHDQFLRMHGAVK